jgi:hypothetical protein
MPADTAVAAPEDDDRRAALTWLASSMLAYAVMTERRLVRGNAEGALLAVEMLDVRDALLAGVDPARVAGWVDMAISGYRRRSDPLDTGGIVRR